jgi:hypothetical protein
MEKRNGGKVAGNSRPAMRQVCRISVPDRQIRQPLAPGAKSA